MESGECVKWESKGYAYAIGDDLTAEEFEVGCEVKLVAPTSLWTLDNHSYTAMHSALTYGFEISWLNLACKKHCHGRLCYFNSSNQNLECPRELDLKQILRNAK